jgi:hypothetical protein
MTSGQPPTKAPSFAVRMRTDLFLLLLWLVFGFNHFHEGNQLGSIVKLPLVGLIVTVTGLLLELAPLSGSVIISPLRHSGHLARGRTVALPCGTYDIRGFACPSCDSRQAARIRLGIGEEVAAFLSTE